VTAELHVRGLKEYKAALRQIDKKLGGELRKGLNEVAQVVIEAARPQVPYLTGAAQASMKAGSSQNAAQIKVGGAKAPHYMWLEFGGRVGRNKSVVRPFIKGGRYVYPTAAQKHDVLVDKLEDVIGALTRRAGF
jgi:hypothetical protein